MTDSGAIDSNAFKNDARSSLLSILDEIGQDKELVIDKSLGATVSLTVPFSTLKDHGVTHIFWLQSDAIERSLNPQSDEATVFITTAEPTQIGLIADQVKNAGGKDVHVIITPERTNACGEILQEKGVLGDVVLHSWKVYFVPLAPDVLSLNLIDGGFSETYLNGVPSAVKIAADALEDIQNTSGLFGRIIGKGDHAKLLADLILHKRKQKRATLAAATEGGLDSLKAKFLGSSNPEGDSTQKDSNDKVLFDSKYGNVFVGTAIDNLVIIDRATDFLTPLLTQLTYEGLIDEYYGISESGSVELPAEIVDPPKRQGSQSSRPAEATETKNVSLSASADPLYKQLQDVNFAVVGRKLATVARQLKSDYDERFQADTVTKISQFVQKLGGLQQVHMSLGFHTRLADDLMKKVRQEEFNKVLEIQQNLVAETLDTSVIRTMIQELINRGTSFTTVVRLLAIECICKGGIKERDLSNIKKDLLQTYGHQHLLTLKKLEGAGLLFSRKSGIVKNLPQLRKQLSLVDDDETGEEETPKDITFTYSGYAPLSVRLIQCVVDKRSVLRPRRLGPSAVTTSTLLASPGWKGAEDILKLISGAAIDEQQRSESHGREDKLRKILVRNSPGHDKTTTMVFFVGGITYAEIAALRFISDHSETTNLIIATTGIINGTKMIESAMKIGT